MGSENVKAAELLLHAAPAEQSDSATRRPLRPTRVSGRRSANESEGNQVVARENVVILPAAQVSSLFHEAEVNLAKIREKLERLRELALQATSVNLKPAEREAIVQEAHALVETIIQASISLRITDRPLLQPSELWVDVEAPAMPGLEITPPAQISFYFSPQRLPIVFLRNLSFRVQTSAIAALQILRQAIEDITNVEVELNQARAELQALTSDDRQSGFGASLSERAEALAQNVIEDLALQARFVAGAQANIKARQVLELLEG
jgi:hypothetical protein